MVRPRSSSSSSASLPFAQARAPLERWFERTRVPATPSPGREREHITRWLELLCEWNGRIDLTAARSGGELVDLMVADAGALSSHLAAGARARVLDVGTGAGAPGMALALLRPDLVVTLCEPLVKRASFLRTVIGTLGRTDVTLVAKRGEALPHGGWDEVMARATLPPEEWLALGARLVKPGGGVWVLLATGEPPALAGAEVTLDERYEWAETGVTRRAVRYRIEG